MTAIVIACVLLAPPGDAGDAPAAKNEQAAVREHLRGEYLADAAKYVFHHDEGRSRELKLVDKPIMRWDTDDDWSGDVFVWTHQGRPEVVGCILSGPAGEASRNVFHEFHLLAEHPIPPVDVHTKRRWTPTTGIELSLVGDAPEPAKNAAGRLAQMRQISRKFMAHMEADGQWELRLLPQPLFRYGEEGTAVVDGALLAYVWSKGTDPELILLLECRKGVDGKLAWQFAPVRFSTRQLWLEYDGSEVWRVDSHREPEGGVNDLAYTTAYARSLPRPSLEPKNEK
jgi:hypothetical protein